MNYNTQAFKNYAKFTGRSRRSEYWYFTLFNWIFIIVAMFLDNKLGTTIGLLPYGYIYFAYFLVTIIPSLSVLARRLHDVGKSGWMFLIVLIPIIGGIWLLVLLATDSQTISNKWGDNPKQ